jgi:hypothetical protein
VGKAASGIAAMTILDKIEQQWLSYVGETGRMPKYLFMGDKESTLLDKAKGMLVLTYRDMWIVLVARDSWLSVGDKYSEG